MNTIISFVSAVSFALLYLWNFIITPTGNFHVSNFWLLLPILYGIFFKLSYKDEDNILKIPTYYAFGGMIPLTIVWMFLDFNQLAFRIGGIFIILGLLMLIGYTYNHKEHLNNYLGIETEEDDGIDEYPASAGDFKLGVIQKKTLGEDGNPIEGEDLYQPTNKFATVPIRDRFVHFLILGVTGSGKTSQSLLPMTNQDLTADNFKFANIDVVQMGQIVLEPKGDYAKTFWAMGKHLESDKQRNYRKFLYSVEDKMVEKIQSLYKTINEYKVKRDGRKLTEEEQERYDYLLSIFNDDSKVKQLSIDDKIDAEIELRDLEGLLKGTPLTNKDQDALNLAQDSLKQLLFVKQHYREAIKLDDHEYIRQRPVFTLFRYASLLTDIIANPSTAVKIYQKVLEQDPNQERDVVLLFDPKANNSPYFNPMYGDEETVVANISSTLTSYMSDSSSYFQTLGKTLISQSVKIAKRVYGDDATLIHVEDLMFNNQGRGEQIIKRLGELTNVNSIIQSENKDLATYFLNDYYSGLKGARGATKTYEQTSGTRNILQNLLTSNKIRRVLNPPAGVGTDIDFDMILRTGDKVALSTDAGLGGADAEKMLGTFLMLQLQTAVFRRPGNPDTRPPVILYIDEFQEYATPEFEKILTQGRSYVVSATMATQTLGLVEEKAGSGLVENIRSNARNTIVYPGGGIKDAKYYQELFGTTRTKKVKRSISQAVVEEPESVMDKIKSEFKKSDKSSPDPRESISEDYQLEDRFTISQIMYGPNDEKRQGSNSPFGYVFYRIVVGNNLQTPGVARIEYIPKDLKVATDTLVAAYDEVSYMEKEEVVENKGVDAIGKQKKTEAVTIEKLTEGQNNIDSNPKAKVNNKEDKLDVEGFMNELDELEFIDL